jgi:hypothetical protein
LISLSGSGNPPGPIGSGLKAKSQKLRAEFSKIARLNTSQLNRLGVAYFLIVYFQFQPPYFGFALVFLKKLKSVGATVISLAFSVIQVRTTSTALLDFQFRF